MGRGMFYADEEKRSKKKANPNKKYTYEKLSVKTDQVLLNSTHQ